MTIGERVRFLREARELSMQGLADVTGLSKAYIVRIETGRPRPVNLSLHTVERLAEGLGASPAWIAFGPVERGAPDTATEESHKPSASR